jgi:hypothetical protein
MTKGEYRVVTNRNPSADDTVEKIKRAAADLIDLIETIPTQTGDAETCGDHFIEVLRLKSLAETHVEDAAMWAVKAATKPAFNKN